MSFYVCGVISDRRGFEHVDLGPERLPGFPPQYLDVPPAGDRLSHGFERIDAGGSTFIKYARYRRIEPNDSESNRGAYVAVGFITARALPMHVAASCIDLASQIFGHLTAFLRPDDRFASEFKLGNYGHGGGAIADLIDAKCSPLLLLDVLMQGMKGQGALGWKPGRPIFIDPAKLDDDGQLDSHLLYFKSGASGSLLRFDRERDRIGRLTQQLLAAADCADRIQEEWLSYQSLINERLPSTVKRGTDLRNLIEELEQLSEAADSIPVARPRYMLSKRADMPHIAEQRIGDAERAPAEPASIASVRKRYASPAPFGRRHHHSERRHRRFRLSLPHTMLIGGAVALATITIFALQFFLDLDDSPPESAVAEPLAPAESPAVPRAEQSAPLEAGDVRDENATALPPRDVARERAALGSSTPE